MRRIDVLIPAAIRAINRQNIPGKNGVVPNEYKGYIDTFGASIVQNGLIPAVVFFETAGGEQDKSITADPEKKNIYQNRNKLMKTILLLLLEKEGNTCPSSPETLYKYIMARKERGMEEKRIRKNIIDAAIAVKLGLRTFEFTKDKVENE
jgi:CRISPR-associated protein Cmr5